MSDQREIEEAIGELTQTARAAVDEAQRLGATAVRARAATSRSVSLTFREGRPERVTESAQRRLTLWLYVDGRYTTCETNHLEPAALTGFLDRAVTLARAVEVDPDRILPDPSLYEGRDDARASALALVDPAVREISPDDRLRYAAAVEAAVRDGAGTDELQTVEARYADSEEAAVQVHSNGFEGVHHETQLWGVADVSLRDEGDRRPSGWGVAASRFRSDLASPEEVAAEALATARARLGARPIETAQLPVIVENRAVGRLLRYLLTALDGRMVQQRSSFLEDARGSAIGSEILDLTDDPFVPGGFGSKLFDSEGITAVRRPMIEEGTLRHFFLDTYYARKLGEQPTTGSASNLVMTPGEGDLTNLLERIERGVLIRGFLGGSSNSTTGDFSLGVHGTLIEGGSLTRAVGEMNISGNHRELWKSLSAAGADVYRYSAVRAPSLLFDDVQLSGR